VEAPFRDLAAITAWIKKSHREFRAREFRRIQQQGLGRPIISTLVGDHRMVAVGNAVHSSKNWKTFHDFLFYYIKEIFGREWGAAEQKKPLAQRHILMRWNDEVGKLHRSAAAEASTSKVLSTPATPILQAYLSLAYNLYLMKHNVELQRTLVARLKNQDESSFHGAYYETFVASIFIKAGYEITFEDEQDGSISHCEFIARSKTSGNQFSIEAKSRFRPVAAEGELKLGVRDKLHAALKKHADHPRVIFIDVNLPTLDKANTIPAWAKEAVNEVREVEQTMLAAEQETPTAYVIITNDPYQYNSLIGLSAVAEGFNIPDFKFDKQFSSLRSALQSRETHKDILKLFEAMEVHSDIPSTFDGEMPQIQLRSANALPRLKIGDRYLIPTESGSEQVGELENAIVLENEKRAYGIYRLDDDRRVMATTPLTDDELEAYNSYPETFFGEIDHNAKRVCKDLVDLYDFFYETYRRTPKEKLIDFMNSASDIELLKSLPQEELAKIYCERLAYNVDGSSGKRT
jgi:hypothetical protein